MDKPIEVGDFYKFVRITGAVFLYRVSSVVMDQRRFSSLLPRNGDITLVPVGDHSSICRPTCYRYLSFRDELRAAEDIGWFQVSPLEVLARIDG